MSEFRISTTRSFDQSNYNAYISNRMSSVIIPSTGANVDTSKSGPGNRDLSWKITQVPKGINSKFRVGDNAYVVQRSPMGSTHWIGTSENAVSSPGYYTYETYFDYKNFTKDRTCDATLTFDYAADDYIKSIVLNGQELYSCDSTKKKCHNEYGRLRRKVINGSIFSRSNQLEIVVHNNVPKWNHAGLLFKFGYIALGSCRVMSPLELLQHDSNRLTMTTYEFFRDFTSDSISLPRSLAFGRLVLDLSPVATPVETAIKSVITDIRSVDISPVLEAIATGKDMLKTYSLPIVSKFEEMTSKVTDINWKELLTVKNLVTLIHDLATKPWSASTWVVFFTLGVILVLTFIIANSNEDSSPNPESEASSVVVPSTVAANMNVNEKVDTSEADIAARKQRDAELHAAATKIHNFFLNTGSSKKPPQFKKKSTAAADVTSDTTSNVVPDVSSGTDVVIPAVTPHTVSETPSTVPTVSSVSPAPVVTETTTTATTTDQTVSTESSIMTTQSAAPIKASVPMSVHVSTPLVPTPSNPSPSAVKSEGGSLDTSLDDFIRHLRVTGYRVARSKSGITTDRVLRLNSKLEVTWSTSMFSHSQPVTQLVSVLSTDDGFLLEFKFKTLQLSVKASEAPVNNTYIMAKFNELIIKQKLQPNYVQSIVSTIVIGNEETMVDDESSVATDMESPRSSFMNVIRRSSRSLGGVSLIPSFRRTSGLSTSDSAERLAEPVPAAHTPASTNGHSVGLPTVTEGIAEASSPLSDTALVADVIPPSSKKDAGAEGSTSSEVKTP